MKPLRHLEERVLKFVLCSTKKGAWRDLEGTHRAGFRVLITDLSKAVHSLGKLGARIQSVFIYFEVF